jgi:penicillin-binding protein 2
MKYFVPSPKKEYESKSKTISRRAFVLTSFKFVFFAAIVSRLFYLQIVKREEFIVKADKNRFRKWKLTPFRGPILDKNDNIIVDNFQVFKIAIIPKETKSFDFFLSSLSKIIAFSASEITFYKKKYFQHNKNLPFVLDKNLNWSEFSKLNYSIQNLEGVQPFVSYERTYLYPYEFSHILGYVSAPNKKDLNSLGALYEGVPNLKVGKIGLEKKINQDLLGIPGSATYEVNAYGRRVKQVVKNNSIDGATIKTTIDKDIQIFAYEQLKNTVGSIVVMDMYGNVLCCVSSPSYDPNKFTYGMSHKEYRLLTEDEKKPLINKALTATYPPASTFKMIVALSALENKIITKNFRHTCKGNVELYDQKYHCWKSRGHGRISLSSAIKESCDIYFYEVARLLGIDRLQKTAFRFGLGNYVFNNFFEEKKGLIPSTSWKQATLGKPWYLGETMISGIGQGFLRTTNAQLCKMIVQLANGGYAIEPTFLRTKNLNLGKKIIEDEKHLEILLSSLFNATNQPGGTSYSSRIVGKMKFTGKTGTAQVRSISDSQRERDLKNKDLPWKFRDHSLFVGYGPTRNPKYGISVIIDHGGSGSAVAAPIARNVMKKIFDEEKKISNV